MNGLYLNFVLILLLFSYSVYSGPILGIDFGTDTMKVVLVERAHMDIMLDDQSSRKSPNVIAFRNEDRYFGKVADDQIRWVPDNVYKYLKDMLGATTLDSERVKAILPHITYADKLFINDTVEGFPFIAIRHDDETEYSVLELVAMIFEKVGKVAKKTLGYAVKDIIITVPPFYTQQEKTALMNAAKLGGFNVLTLIDETSAVALSYARKQVKSLEKPENIIFFDTGHSNLVISLYNFTNTTVYSKLKAKRIDAVQFNPLGRAWSHTLGGREYDLVLFNLIKDRILDTFQIKELPEKAYRYLTRTVAKLKVTLSANKEASYRIENILDNKDFSTVVTREEFDAACAPLFKSTTQFVVDFLQKHDLLAEQITAFEMIGGSGRLPGLQEMLLPVIKKDSFDLHLNGDESSAFGAAIYSKIRNGVTVLKMRDNIEWEAIVAINDLETPQDEEPLSKTALLFPQGTRIGAKKKFEFHHDRPFTVDLKYVECEDCISFPDGSDHDIINYEISGFPRDGEFNLTKAPLVTVILELTTSGTFQILRAEANIEYLWSPEPEPVVIQVQDETYEDNPDVLAEENEPQDNDVVDENHEDDTDNEFEEDIDEEQEDQPVIEEEKKEEPQVEYPIEKKRSITLRVNENNKHSIPSTLLSESRRKLWKIEEREQLKVRTEERRNDLEALLFTTRDTLNYNEEFQSTSKQEEKDALEGTLASLFEWFDEEGYQATIEVVDTKIKELNSALKPISDRVTEYHAIPEAISECKITVAFAKTSSPKIFEERKVSDDEISQFVNLCEEVEKYVDEHDELFKQNPQDVDFVIKSNELSRKCKPIISKLKIFERRPKRPVEAPEVIEPAPTETPNTEIPNSDNQEHEHPDL